MELRYDIGVFGTEVLRRNIRSIEADLTSHAQRRTCRRVEVIDFPGQGLSPVHRIRGAAAQVFVSVGLSLRPNARTGGFPRSYCPRGEPVPGI